MIAMETVKLPWMQYWLFEITVLFQPIDHRFRNYVLLRCRDNPFDFALGHRAEYRRRNSLVDADAEIAPHCRSR